MAKGYVVSWYEPSCNTKLFCDADTGDVCFGTVVTGTPVISLDVDSLGPCDQVVELGYRKDGVFVMHDADVINEEMDQMGVSLLQRGTVYKAKADSVAWGLISYGVVSPTAAQQLADFEQAAWDGNLPELERLSKVVGINALLDSERIQKEFNGRETALSVVQTAHYDTGQCLRNYKLSLDFLKANGALVASKLPPGQAAAGPALKGSGIGPRPI